ncbi:hypothetical protein BC332_13317 [Capsicum chinense]|nr:hypothetical protein BC332_13317 [Capsicum chinense]
MEFFGEKTITRKIILEGQLVVIDDGSHSHSGSDADVGANDAPLTIFETTSHYDYDHTGCTVFSQNFATSSKCSACKCQDCKAKHNGVINAINALTVSVKEIASKKCVLPSKRISYPYTPLEIKAARKRRKHISKASSSIEKSKMQRLYLCVALMVDVTIEATTEEHNITVDNPSTASREEEKVKPISSGEQKNYSFEGNCGPFVAAYAEYLSYGLQVPNDELDDGLLHKSYATLLWKYGEAKAQKSYASDIKDP